MPMGMILVSESDQSSDPLSDFEPDSIRWHPIH
jgi:hypothetical protein